jgi:DNA-binding NarL/FixJ family response regulator
LQTPHVMKKLNILIAEDQQLIRDCLRFTLRAESFYNKIYEAANGQEALAIVAQHSVDVVLLDISMPVMCGRETAAVLLKDYPHIKIVVVTDHEGHPILFTLLKMGAHSILYKRHGFLEMVNAIKQVCQTAGGTYYPECILEVIRQYANCWDELATKEIDDKDKLLISGLIKGLSTKQLADSLNMSARTAETRRQRLLKKVGVKNSVELIAYAFRNGILQ